MSDKGVPDNRVLDDFMRGGGFEKAGAFIESQMGSMSDDVGGAPLLCRMGLHHFCRKREHPWFRCGFCLRCRRPFHRYYYLQGEGRALLARTVRFHLKYHDGRRP